MEKPTEISHNKDKGFEWEKKTWFFDIRQKHPRSEDLYAAQWDDNFDKLVNESSNPFTELDGKEVIYEGKLVGYLRVNKEIYKQCVLLAGGKTDCGWYYELTTNLDAQKLDRETAIKLMQNIIKDIDIDYFEINDWIPKSDGGIKSTNRELLK